MKKYDYKKAIEIINKTEGLVKASLCMHEDWKWTAETVWEKCEWVKNLETKPEIAGIDGSTWATPVLFLFFKNGKKKVIECFIGETSESRPIFMGSGIFSSPNQDQISSISKEQS